ncbi:TPA: N-acetyltransferase [Candidatus Poribacteria bacterium]|nr:N-acetyltransferase [Candidatus Poribacteria bacterium]HEX29364.1 N-acetyltransferase [Candidatus Poribacteria bacterium]
MVETGEKSRGVKRVIRKASMRDIRHIHRLVNFYADKGAMLPRPLSEICEDIRNFFVCEIGGEIVGCCALQPSWIDLAEIRSLAVDERYQGKGLGKKLVKVCLEDARSLGIRKVFALTNSPGFFERLGFERIPKEELPHKIWSECIRCPKFPNCDEVAVQKILD